MNTIRKKNYLTRILVSVLCVVLFTGTAPTYAFADTSTPQAVSESGIVSDVAVKKDSTEDGEDGEFTKCTDDGDGTEASPFIIHNETQLVHLATSVNDGTDTYKGKYFELANNIAISDNFPGIGYGTSTSTGYFGGIFDGKDYKITADVAKEGTATYSKGLFGNIINATIKDLTFAGSVTGTYNIGGIAGYVRTSTIENCVNEATITVKGPGGYNDYDYGAGGIAGYTVAAYGVTDASKIINCSNKGEIKVESGSVNTGGILGYLYSRAEVVDCINETDLTFGAAVGSTYYNGHGGIIGKVYGSNASSSYTNVIVDNINKGDLKSNGAYNIGGMIGLTYSVTTNEIYNCANEGDITGSLSSATTDCVGGIIGYMYAANTVSESYNKGDIKGKSGYIGGIVGGTGSSTSPTVRSCYNTGKVESTSTYSTAAVGGIVGKINSSTGKVLNSYSTGIVTSSSITNNIGGIIGGPYSTSTINSTYISENKYLKNSAPQGIGGVVDSEGFLTFEKSDIDADFIEDLGSAYQADLTSNINDGYPILRWQNPDARYQVGFTVKDGETATSLDDANIEIEGQTRGVNGKFEVAPGTYEYKVSRNGYTSITDTVTIKKSSKTVNVDMNSKKYTYTINVKPADANIVIKNAALDQTLTNPTAIIDKDNDTATYEFTLADKNAYGEYSYRINKFQYVDQTGILEVSADGSKDITLIGAEKKNLKFKVTPENATVILTNVEYDSRVIHESEGNGEVIFKAIPGEYTYKVKAKGYLTSQGSVTVPDVDEVAVNLEEKSVWDGSIDTDWYTYNKDASTYELSEPEELAGLAYLTSYVLNDTGKTIVDFKGKTIILANDMDLGNISWLPIGCRQNQGNDSYPFKGTFNGQGHSITNLKLDTTQRQGLFGVLDGATVKNLTVNVDCNVTSPDSGGFAGKSIGSTISNITVNGKVNSTGAYTGGLVGEADSDTVIVDCVNNASVTGTYQVGGIVGYTVSSGMTIKRCINNGDVSATMNGPYSYGAGGIVGLIGGDTTSKTVVQYCINKGDISGSIRNMGGIAGAQYYYSYSATDGDASILDSYNTGNIDNEYTSGYSGGIIGSTSFKNIGIKNCYTIGDIITVSGGIAGGINGYSINDDVNTGYVSNNYYLENDGYKGNGRTGTDSEGAYESFVSSSNHNYSDLIQSLGNAYKADIKEDDDFKYNNGFPILRYQDPDSMYNLTLEISYNTELNKGSESPAVELNDADDKIISPLQDGSYDLENGKYKYKISQKGYHDSIGEITINNESIAKKIELTAVKYTYKIEGSEGDFTLYKDDQKIPHYSYDKDNDVLTYELYNGTYDFVSKKFGHDKVTGKITIDYGNGSKTITFTEKSTYKLNFSIDTEEGSFGESDPVVFIYSQDDDFKDMLVGEYDRYDFLQTASRNYPIGDYSYKIKAEGFETEEGTFDITDDTTIKKTMQVKTGWGGSADVDTDWYTDNPNASSFTIKNEAEMAGLAKLVNDETSHFAGKTITLAKDLTFKKEPWVPIGDYTYNGSKYFAGTLDGNNKTITMNEIDLDASSFTIPCVGLFGYLSGATVKDLTLRGTINQTYTGSKVMLYYGGISGYANDGTSIERCSNQMNVSLDFSEATGTTCNGNVGGLIGWGLATGFKESSNIAKLNVVSKGSGTARTGGLCAFGQYGSASLAGTVDSCYNTGNMSAKAATSHVGGLFGTSDVSYLTMKNSYSTGSLNAEATGTAYTKALIGNISNGTGSLTNNYYLDTLTYDPSGAAKSSEYMKSTDFVNTLGAGFAQNPLGEYPINSWEKAVHHISVTQNPGKLVYDDMEKFDDTGMEVTAYMDEEENDAVVLESGWSILDGNSLKPTQTTVTIEYKGAKTTIPVTVNQVVHVIDGDELGFSVKAPVTGEIPQKEIKLTSSQKAKFSADLKWTKAGKEFSGKFEDATYYRAKITLDSKYTKDDVYYAFNPSSKPLVDEAYDIVNKKTSKNSDNENTTVVFEVTYKVTSSETKNLTDKISHLYYEGDSNGKVDFGRFLDREVIISGGTNTTDKVLTVADIENKVLNENVGHEGVYRSDYKVAGINLYSLLLENGLDQNAKDATKIYVYGKAESDVTEITVGDLKAAASGKTPTILAYGNVNSGLPLASAYGPLYMVVENNDITWQKNVTKIVIGKNDALSEYKVKFNVNEEGSKIKVRDEFGNIKTSTSDVDVYSLADGFTYSYEVSKNNFTVESGEFIVNGKDQEINVTLTPCWDGKTYKEPNLIDGVYQIGTPAELMWWNEHGTRSDSVRLTADIAINNGVNYDYVWNTMCGNREDAAFTGTFDGNGHVITGFYIDRENTISYEMGWSDVMMFTDRISQIGLFGYASNATIKNLGIEGKINVFDRPDSQYADWMQLGGIVGYAHGSTTISDCYTNLGIVYEASMETETFAGYPLAGHGYACDTFIGGIAGSVAGAAKIENCYTKGTIIGANTRTVNLGGIVGGMRSATTNVDKCYSTARIKAISLEGTSYESALGGIGGNTSGVFGIGNIKNSFALNGGIAGDDDTKLTAGRVAGGESDNLSNNYGLDSMSFTGVSNDRDSAGANTRNGADITAEKAKTSSAYSGSSWNANNWQLDKNDYPWLAWQTKSPGADMIAVYAGWTDNSDAEEEWDGYFGSLTPPPYFNVYFKVDGHIKRLAKKYTRADMQQMATDDNQGNLYYSSKSYGSNAGRAVKEYVYLETLFNNAGVRFHSGDLLSYGYNTYSYDYLMADRYYFPEWTNNSDTGKEAIEPVVALKSYGDSQGVTKNQWNYYINQADYLYAYMLTFGQETPTDSTYDRFMRQQVETTVNYDKDSSANYTVKKVLSDKVVDTKQNLSVTLTSVDGEDVPSGKYYVSEEIKNALQSSVNVAETVLASGSSTNDDVMNALEDLESKIKKFDESKKKGLKSDDSELESIIAVAEAILNSVVESSNGENVFENTTWATKEQMDKLRTYINIAKSIVDGAPQEDIDTATFELKCILEDFVSDTGKIETIARTSAINELTALVDSLDGLLYRESELTQIKKIQDEAVANIKKAKTLYDIGDVLAKSKADINSVPTKDIAIREEAKQIISDYIDISKYDRAERGELNQIISEYGDAIDKAKNQTEINNLVAEAKTEIDKIKTSTQKKELAARKTAALTEVEAYMNNFDKYYDTERIMLLKHIVNYSNIIKDAETVTEVDMALKEAKVCLGQVKTKAQIDAEAGSVLGDTSTPKKAAPKNFKVKAQAKKAKLTWSKSKSITKYQVAYKQKGNKKWKYKSVSSKKKTVTIKKLKSKKKYQFKIRSYKTKNGKKIYSKWSKTKTIKIK